MMVLGAVARNGVAGAMNTMGSAGEESPVEPGNAHEQRSELMQFHKSRWAATTAGVIAGGLIVGLVAVASQDNQPTEAEIMAQVMAFGTPGEHHQHLARWEGDWDLTVKSWMAADAAPSESTAKATSKMIFGGRYLQEKVSGTFDMGDQTWNFEGMAITGYDNQKKQYFSIWLDNMSTARMEEWGTCTPDGKTINTSGTMFVPWMGTEVQVKSKARLVDANTRVLESWLPDHTGKMYKHMEITYKRR